MSMVMVMIMVPAVIVHLFLLMLPTTRVSATIHSNNILPHPHLSFSPTSHIRHLKDFVSLEVGRRK
ncbi:hypothetical protein M440DRAFT_1398360 [Trichoderma longibrachiatum ATCC 18648]|uniref:Secreted protein n=1 Tax=Trichoderma longibrachiatum ATCC 18648 TaxID=983965 RepID=A0A2T4CC27_TRILO|nr:hypothetical protein M440DRAFT_1398360 [Trichoderma longibrachiatum ATCC 18648]